MVKKARVLLAVVNVPTHKNKTAFLCNSTARPLIACGSEMSLSTVFSKGLVRKVSVRKDIKRVGSMRVSLASPWGVIANVLAYSPLVIAGSPMRQNEEMNSSSSQRASVEVCCSAQL